MRLPRSAKNMAVRSFTLFAAAILLTVVSAHSQTRKSKAAANKPMPVQEETRAETNDAVPAPTPSKRNERPLRSETPQVGDENGTSNPGSSSSNSKTVYKYEFSQPEFIVSNIKIEHDPNGVGAISFKKKGAEDLITDPIRVSPKSIDRINDALAALDFLSSTDNYQYEKDYSHLGVIKFALTRDGRSRDVSFSWTENKDAKILMDEYRRIGNQFIWIFDISLSRENQPLDAPRLMDSLDGMIKRNEISDPLQMEPFLRELSNDERIPLIARNHASRLVAQFEKERKKNDK